MTVTALTPQQKLSAAFLLVEAKAPYVTAMLLALSRRERVGLGTFGVTKDGIMYWDPEAVERWTVEEIAAVLFHEVQHLLRKHADRCVQGGYDQAGFNVAGDLEINDDMASGGWKLPAGCLYPCDHGLKDGELAETYYRKARERAQKEKARAEKEQCKKQDDPADEKGRSGGDDEAEKDGRAGEGEGSSDGGEGATNGGDGVPASGKGGRGTPLSGTGKKEGGEGGERPEEEKKEGKPRAGGGHCGSAGGNPIENEEKRTDLGESDIEARRQEVAEKAVRYAAQHGRGSVPDGMLRWAQEFVKPAKIPWQQKLRRFVRAAVAFRAGQVASTYLRPNRRQTALRQVCGTNAPTLSGWHAPVPKVAVVVDTSGSMGTSEIERALSETNAVLKAVGSRVTFLSCDAEVHSLREVRTVEEAVREVKGGGGTNFVPAFDALGKLTRAKRPDIVVFVTDGCGPAPAQAPQGCHVIWVLVGPYKRKPCEWGEHVEVEEDAA